MLDRFLDWANNLPFYLMAPLGILLGVIFGIAGAALLSYLKNKREMRIIGGGQHG